MINFLGSDKKTDVAVLSNEVSNYFVWCLNLLIFLNKILKTLDKNSDNQVSKEEFINACMGSLQLKILLSPFN